MSEDKEHCEICGVEDSKDNPLMNWWGYNLEDKIACSKCTDAETKRKLAMIDDMVKHPRKYNKSKAR